MGSPPLLRRPAASGGGFVALLAVPVAVAVAGLAVVATLQGPHAGPAPGVDQAAALRARVAAAPQDATAWAELGTLVLRLAADTGDPRRYPDADAALGRSLQLRPDGNAAALGGLAALRTAQRRYAEAQDLARRALALDPNDPAVWGTLADAASGLGRYDESRVAVGHMFERRADVAALTRSAALDETFGRVDAARATLERAVGAAASPAETAQAHAALADLAFAGGDPAEAYRRIRLARTADPDDPNLLAAQATAEAALGMTPAALADYTTAVDSAAPGRHRRAASPSGRRCRHADPLPRPDRSRAGARPQAPDAVGGAAARAAAGLAVGGRRTVAPRYLAAAGELFEAVGRPGDARRAYASFTAMACAVRDERRAARPRARAVRRRPRRRRPGPPARRSRAADRADACGAGRLRLGADGERPRRRGGDLVGQGDFRRRAQRPVRLPPRHDRELARAATARRSTTSPPPCAPTPGSARASPRSPA